MNTQTKQWILFSMFIGVVTSSICADSLSTDYINELKRISRVITVQEKQRSILGGINLGVGVAGILVTVCDVAIKHPYTLPTLRYSTKSIELIDTTVSLKTDWSYLHTVGMILSTGFIIGGTIDLYKPSSIGGASHNKQEPLQVNYKASKSEQIMTLIGCTIGVVGLVSVASVIASSK